MDPRTYYLLLQIGASLVIAMVGIMVGLLVAWLIWGRNQAKVNQSEKRIAELNALLEDRYK